MSKLIDLDTSEEREHPITPYIRMDRMPHIWCPTCGIGTVVKCFATALGRSKLDLDKVSVVSGIGCTGRVAGYVKMDSFHSTHGRALPFATGLKLGRPELTVAVISGDGDLMGIGGNHFIHAARRNMDLLVILVNNFIYGMTGGQNAPTTPLTARSSTMPLGNFERPFNLPHMAATCGATYVARWTSMHTAQMTRTFTEALKRKGFRFIEVIAPCSTLYARLNKLGTGLDLMTYYRDNFEIKNKADTRELDLDFQSKIICGKFVDEERPTFLEAMEAHYRGALGDKYVPMPPEGGCSMGRTEVRVTGYGGQGVVLISTVIGRAWAVHAGKHAAMIQSFGPEARGSSCSATLAMSETEVLYPYVRHPDVLAAMSSEGFELYKNELKDDGVVIYESNLVHPVVKPTQRAYGIPSTRIAEQLGRVLVQNVVMLGFFSAITKLVPMDAMREALRHSVPSGTEELNLKAFEKGREYAEELLAGRTPEEAKG